MNTYTQPTTYKRQDGAVLVVRVQWFAAPRRAVGFTTTNAFAVWMTPDLKHEYSRHLLPPHFTPRDVYRVGRMI